MLGVNNSITDLRLEVITYEYRIQMHLIGKQNNHLENIQPGVFKAVLTSNFGLLTLDLRVSWLFDC